MRVQFVHFEAFKSLYDVTVPMGDLTVLTGTNGSGKSNLVDGLDFLSNVYTYGLDFAVSHGGGYENIAHRRTRRARRPIRVELQIEATVHELLERFPRTLSRSQRGVRADDSALLINHSFSFRAASQKLTADFEVERETLTISLPEGRRLARVRRYGTSVELEDRSSDSGTEELIDRLLFSFKREDLRESLPLPPNELMLVRRFYLDVSWVLSNFLSSLRVFQLSPHTSRQSGVPSPAAQLDRHGENLPGAADNLRRNHGDQWVQIESAMRAIIPTLREIAIAYTEDRRLAVQFREEGVGRPWNASEVSDGTIQTFALLVAIFDPRSSILVIEELENALHPWILRHLLRLCAESSRQVLLTSHSPVLLDHVPPEAVQMMWMRDGRTRVAPLLELDPDVRESLLRGDLSVFEVYDSGVLAEGIPRGLGGDKP